MNRLPLPLRRVLSVSLLLSAMVATVATSPAPTGLSAQLQRDFTLDAQHPSQSLHVMVHLSAEANGDVGTGMALNAPLRISESSCVVGVDTFNDAGVCMDQAPNAQRPVLQLTLLRDGAAADAGTQELNLFEGCPVGQACDEGVTFTIAAPPGNTATIQSDITLWVKAESAVLGSKLPAGATLTIVEQ